MINNVLTILTNNRFSAPVLHGSILSSASHCWFARERAVSKNNKVWIGQVHNDGSGYTQHIIEVNSDTGLTTANKVGTVVEFDDHNEPSILIRSSDDRLFIAYAEHVGGFVRTRISTNPLDASSWQSEKTYDLGSSGYSYCSAFQAQNHDIFIFFRDSTVPSSWAYIKSIDNGETFSGLTYLYEGEDSAYCNMFQSDTDKNLIHIINSQHPNSPGYGVVRHFYFDMSTEKAYSSDGTDISAYIPLSGSEMTTVYAGANPFDVWIEDLIVYNGTPMALFTKIYSPDDYSAQKKYLMYSKLDGGAWIDAIEIHLSLGGYISGNQFAYPPLASFLRSNPNQIIAAKKDGTKQVEIFLLEINGSNVIQKAQITKNSMYPQWRPITVNSNKYNVYWLNQIEYNTYTDYIQELNSATI